MAVALGAGAAVLPVAGGAAPPTIQAYTSTGAYASSYWSPAYTNATTGDTQQWAAYSGQHGLAIDGTNWPPNCPGGALPTSCVFTARGTYNFHCSVHGTSMSGYVTVSDPAPSPSPTATNPSPTPHPASPSPSPTAMHAPSPTPTHTAPAATPGTGAAASPGVVVRPTDFTEATSPSPTSSPGSSPTPDSGFSPTSPRRGSGSPVLPVVVGLVILAALGAGGYYFMSRRAGP